VEAKDLALLIQDATSNDPNFAKQTRETGQRGRLTHRTQPPDSFAVDAVPPEDVVSLRMTHADQLLAS
jgi:hypothetical protein